jgi:formiminotetrahydrofolate cyclodeaminase
MEAGRAARAARKDAGTDAVSRARRAEAEHALEAATRATIQVPLSVMKDALRAAEIAQEAMQRGMAAALSDAGVAALAACVAVEGAYYNVRINLSGAASLPDADALRQEAERMLSRAEEVRRSATARMREGI